MKKCEMKSSFVVYKRKSESWLSNDMFIMSNIREMIPLISNTVKISFDDHDSHFPFFTLSELPRHRTHPALASWPSPQFIILSKVFQNFVYMSIYSVQTSSNTLFCRLSSDRARGPNCTSYLPLLSYSRNLLTFRISRQNSVNRFIFCPQ